MQEEQRLVHDGGTLHVICSISIANIVAHNHFIIVAISWLSYSLGVDPCMELANITMKEVENNEGATNISLSQVERKQIFC